MPKRRPQGGKVADPAFRAQRARTAGRAAHDIGTHVRAVERRADELTPEHYRQLRAVVDAAPPFTSAQRTQLTALLSTSAGETADAVT